MPNPNTTAGSDGKQVDLEKLSIKEPVLLLEDINICPVCGSKSLVVREYLYEIKFFGRILLTLAKCAHCGYAYKDVRLAEPGKPKKIIVHVRGERELRYLLIKSSYSAVIIPKMELEMIPGPASHGFITTVEGILHRFLEVLSVVCKDNPNEKCLEIESWIKSAIDGKEEFDLIICDYEGASKVVGKEGVEETELDETCLERKPEWLSAL